MGILEEKKPFQTERKADVKTLREMPGIWSSRTEASVSRQGRTLGDVVPRGPGHMRLTNCDINRVLGWKVTT